MWRARATGLIDGETTRHRPGARRKSDRLKHVVVWALILSMVGGGAVIVPVKRTGWPAATSAVLGSSLGGFYAGYTESAWAAPWGLPGISRFGILHTDNGGSYAYQQRHLVQYSFTGGNGFFYCFATN